MTVAPSVRRMLLVPLLAMAALPMAPRVVHAQADTIAGAPARLFTLNDALLGAGVALATLAIRPLDEQLAAAVTDSGTQANRKLRRLASFVRTTAEPGSYLIGGTMYLAGRLSGNAKLADVGLHGTEALAIGEAAAVLIKGMVGRQRPSVKPRNSHSYGLLRGFREGDDYRSFPSGHTVAGFAAAAAVTSEVSRYAPGAVWVVGPALYGGAALVGASRMYNNRHWASDVIVGAGIGTFAGLKTVRWHHTHAGNTIDRVFLTGALVPGDGIGDVRWSIVPASFVSARH
ncbi:MAG: phosphatase PAP2 family protein [Gemmatimonadaceae bacterium]|nr:phosphatase PAP2 family protein [Gemmatimonadaceae bacterium]